MSSYTWFKDLMYHQVYKKGKGREVLVHRLPYKASYYANVLEEGDVPSKASGRCVCHLMKLYPGEQVTAWPYRAIWGNVGISWYHNDMPQHSTGDEHLWGNE